MLKDVFQSSIYIKIDPKSGVGKLRLAGQICPSKSKFAARELLLVRSIQKTTKIKDFVIKTYS